MRLCHGLHPFNRLAPTQSDLSTTIARAPSKQRERKVSRNPSFYFFSFPLISPIEPFSRITAEKQKKSARPELAVAFQPDTLPRAKNARIQEPRRLAGP
jgi:hypothetical protein